jgi:hypothetical protein
MLHVIQACMLCLSMTWHLQQKVLALCTQEVLQTQSLPAWHQCLLSYVDGPCFMMLLVLPFVLIDGALKELPCVLALSATAYADALPFSWLFAGFSGFCGSTPI